MKEEKEIKERIEDAKSNLVGADGNNIPYLQGHIQGLQWALAKEEEKPKTEEKPKEE